MKRKGVWIWGGIIGCAIPLIVLYYLFNPETTRLFPQCPFLTLTGLKCPGCGSQRAIHALLHFDFYSAFKYNALLIASLPIVTALGYAEINRTKKPGLYSKIHHPKFIWGYLIATILWWGCRNIFNF